MIKIVFGKILVQYKLIGALFKNFCKLLETKKGGTDSFFYRTK